MSNNLESNKIFASILLSSLIAMLAGFFADILYKPNTVVERGFTIFVEGGTEQDVIQKEEYVNIKLLVDQASAQEGKNIFKKCVSCHSITKDGDHKIGPNLYDIFYSKKAGQEGFNYSKAFQNLEGIWDEESLFEFLKKPSKFVPGTKMSFIGLKKNSELAAMIAYLKENSVKSKN
ncbi:MAG: cytochrome c family protein [Rickettsia sp.]|nr:cytochrome c family protein [Rickettsia sp.]